MRVENKLKPAWRCTLLSLISSYLLKHVDFHKGCSEPSCMSAVLPGTLLVYCKSFCSDRALMRWSAWKNTQFCPLLLSLSSTCAIATQVAAHIIHLCVASQIMPLMSCERKPLPSHSSEGLLLQTVQKPVIEQRRKTMVQWLLYFTERSLHVSHTASSGGLK